MKMRKGWYVETLNGTWKGDCPQWAAEFIGKPYTVKITPIRIMGKAWSCPGGLKHTH